MKYNKPPLSFTQQADLLIQRGLVVEREKLITYLKSVNYYRFTGYLLEKMSDIVAKSNHEEFVKHFKKKTLLNGTVQWRYPGRKHSEF